jgi:hypothetical protein
VGAPHRSLRDYAGQAFAALLAPHRACSDAGFGCNKKPEKILSGKFSKAELIFKLETNFENLNSTAKIIEGN